ncbi:helix-turn-helix domain-containing protein [Fodinicola acaciae]|uniref:PucR family transcriptional regulator n=1 Tax=Fodinicola acaciae TaxID=2681555 RepID=UPI001C9E6B87|nr:helix-turn-helix domain-containing protein [Fodinicola acaciae]
MAAKVHDASKTTSPPPRQLRQLAETLRPELPSLAAEIIDEIRRSIPEYAQPLDGPYGHSLRVGTAETITSFVDQLSGKPVSTDHLEEICRRLGENEERVGRSMDQLQAAYRIGARVAWQRIMKVGRRYPFSSQVVSMLADRIFAYIDELASLSLEGYLRAKAGSAQARRELHRRLLRAILADSAELPELAEAAGWPLPEAVTMIAVDGEDLPEDPLLPPVLLADLHPGDPCLLAPGEVGAADIDEVHEALCGVRLAIGVTVPLQQAADSLRWAKQALQMAAAGALPNAKTLRCEEHLITLWLAADPALVEQIGDRVLGPLAELPVRQRERLSETLLAWLRARGSAALMAEQLQIHPQTVRYRIRQLEDMLPGQLRDPDSRWAMEAVLRSRAMSAYHDPDVNR